MSNYLDPDDPEVAAIIEEKCRMTPEGVELAIGWVQETINRAIVSMNEKRYNDAYSNIKYASQLARDLKRRYEEVYGTTLR